MIYERASAVRLAIARIAVYAVWLFDVALDPFTKLAQLPFEWFSPHGPWLLLPEPILRACWDGRVLMGLKLATLACVGLAMLGARRPRLWGALAAASLILTTSFVRGFGHADHSQLQLLFVTLALPFLPAWDALCIHREPGAGRSDRAYSASFVALALVFGFPYLFTGAYRLAHEGISIFVGDSLRYFITRDTLMLDDFETVLGLELVVHPAWNTVLKLGFAAVTAAELAAPWAYLRPRWCVAWLLLILPFHLLAPVLMHVLFQHNLVLLAVLYAWPLLWPRIDGQAARGASAPIARSRAPRQSIARAGAQSRDRAASESTR